MELLRFEMLLPAFILVLARIAGMMIAVPLFSNAQIPTAFKVLFVAILSLMVFPAVAGHVPQVLTLGEAAAGLASEFIIGELLGLAAGLVLFAAQMAGNVVSHQAGISIGQVFNPLLDEETSILDQLWFFTALMLFLGLRGHVAIVGVVLSSFNLVPPLSFVVDTTLADTALGILRSMFEVALRLSAPAVAALLLSSLVLGFLTKTMPQLNILSVGFSLKIVIALLVVGITIQSSGGLLMDAFADGLDAAGAYFQSTATRVIHGG